MTILEPSAGKGNIADKIRQAYPHNPLSVVERMVTLQNILQAKEHNLVGFDFLEYEGQYDRILMNPPFEDGQDIDHVLHAFSCLKSGGVLVSVMCEGVFFRGDKKSQHFREWLAGVGGYEEALPAGSFKSSERPTGVATRLVMVTKP
jgi:16S rRNA G1207 methylase RsmC